MSDSDSTKSDRHNLSVVVPIDRHDLLTLWEQVGLPPEHPARELLQISATPVSGPYDAVAVKLVRGAHKRLSSIDVALRSGRADPKLRIEATLLRLTVGYASACSSRTERGILKAVGALEPNYNGKVPVEMARTYGFRLPAEPLPGTPEELPPRGPEGPRPF